jgi:hypothetical protein
VKTVVEDIRKMLRLGIYKDEQHIRLSLVSRIFLELGWNIWNPSEYYTEYQAITLNVNTQNILGNGRVDVALGRKLQTKNETLYALVEVKAIGRIDKESRIQLQAYSANKKQLLSVLTDGVVWEFYLNTLPINSKNYTDCLFNSANLQSDDIDILILVFRNLLSPCMIGKIKSLAKRMRSEFEYIQLIKKYQSQAQRQFPDDPIKQLDIVTDQIREEIGNKSNIADKVRKYWKRTIALGGLDEDTGGGGNGDGNGDGDEEIKYDYRKDYRFTDPRYVKIGKSERQVVDDWKHLMQVIYNYLIENHATDLLKSSFNLLTKNPSDFREPLALVRGYYAEKHLSNSAKVANCRQAIQQARLDPKEQLTIWYVDKKRK